MSDTEFIKCTLAQGHFCNLNTALHHIDSNPMCLTALFLKDNNKIQNQCKLAVTNITGPQANYLDQGNWAISVTEPTQMEIKCSDHTHIKTLQPSITLINLQPACSAFSPLIKLPPYFKQYSKGFHVALRAANLHLPRFSPSDFRIWNTFNLSKIKPTDIDNLKKLAPAPAIPINQLRTQIASFRQIDTNKSTSWTYYVGGGSGSGSILLIVICCLVCWRCKHHQSNGTRSPSLTAYTAPENKNMSTPRVGAIGVDQNSAPGQVTVGIQDSVGDKRMVLNYDMQNAFASALLDQLEDLGADDREHHRRLRPRQYSAIPHMES